MTRTRWLMLGLTVLVLALVALFLLVSGQPGAEGIPTAGPSDAPASRQRDDHPTGPATGAQPSATALPSSPTAAGASPDAGDSAAAPDAGPDATSRALYRATLSDWLKKNASEAERAVDHFCEENRKAKSDHLFPPPAGERDAAAFLVNRVDWEDDVRPPGTLHLPEALRLKLRAAGANWPAQLTAADLAGLDFTWLKQLSEYDTWSVASFGPLRDDKPVAFLSSPIPNYVSLVEWAKLRFVLAFADGDFAAADAEVRHLAALVESNGLVIADAIAVALLRLDAAARSAAAAAGRDVSAWPVVDEEAAARYRRLALAGPSFFAPGVPEATVKKAHDCLANPCSALAEGLGLQVSLSGLAGADTRALVERFADEAACSRALFDRVRRSQPPESGGAFTPPPGIGALYPDGGVP